MHFTNILATAVAAAAVVQGAASTNFPSAVSTVTKSTAVPVAAGQTFDGSMRRYQRGPNTCQAQTETGQKDAMFILEDGAKIKNVILGAAQAEGIHCKGTCTIQNVWWEDVCEDAATFLQSSGTSYIIGGGAMKASDKVFQFNGKGTLNIKDFYVNTYGKLVRSCGNCANNGGPRHVVIDGVIAKNGGALCGINTNFGDTCRITNSCQDKGKSCELYKGIQKGQGESPKLSSGPDNKSCWVSGLTKTC